MKKTAVILLAFTLLFSSCTAFREMGQEIKVMVRDGKATETTYPDSEGQLSLDQPEPRREFDWSTVPVRINLPYRMPFSSTNMFFPGQYQFNSVYPSPYIQFQINNDITR